MKIVTKFVAKKNLKKLRESFAELRKVLNFADVKTK